MPPGNSLRWVKIPIARACLAVGGLAVVAVILGYQVYRDRQKTTGVEISIGERGISIEKK